MEGNKPKVLWISDLAIPTGFGNVAQNITSHLTDKYEIVGIGINYRGDPHSCKFPIYPASTGGKVFGEDRLISILNGVKFDILYILNDAWIVAMYLDVIKKNVKPEKIPKIVVYTPVDSLFHDPAWYANFDMVSRAVSYTDFGVRVINDPKCAPNLKLDVIPHGVNKNIFYKKFTNRRDAKIALIGNKRNPDSFVFLNANRNQPRKRLDITMEAFKLFAEGKEDVLLHMHSGVRDSHIDIPKLAKRLDIDNKLLLTNLNSGVQTVSEEKLNEIYNSSDVGLNSSLGEGWGLPNIEHAVTGAPQIVPNHSACAEIYEDCGLLVPIVTNYTLDHSMTVGGLVSPEAMAEKMNLIYSDKELYNSLSKKSMEKFSEDKYSWEEISNKWDTVFKEVL